MELVPRKVPKPCRPRWSFGGLADIIPTKTDVIPISSNILGYLNFKYTGKLSKVISDLESNLKNVESHFRCKKNPRDKLRAVSLRLQQGVDQTAGKLYVPCPLHSKRA